MRALSILHAATLLGIDWVMTTRRSRVNTDDFKRGGDHNSIISSTDSNRDSQWRHLQGSQDGGIRDMLIWINPARPFGTPFSNSTMCFRTRALLFHPLICALVLGCYCSLRSHPLAKRHVVYVDLMCIKT